MGRLSEGELVGARRRVDSLWRDLGRIEVSASLARHAADLAEDLGLRAYDAVHLASLLAVAEPETVLAAADGQLREAAHTLGVAVARLG
jgi:predicted nucleic acid-binding protein